MSRVLSLTLPSSFPPRSPARALRGSFFPRGVFVALALLMAAPVTGQIAATNFDEPRFKVKAGETVYVTDDIGTGGDLLLAQPLEVARCQVPLTGQLNGPTLGWQQVDFLVKSGGTVDARCVYGTFGPVYSDSRTERGRLEFDSLEILR